MTRFDYGPLREVAEDLIFQFGQEVQLRKAGENVGEDYAPKRTGPTTTNVNVVDLDVMTKPNSENSAKKTHRTLFMSTSAGVAPLSGDRIYIDSTWHKIDTVEPLQPGGSALLYEVMIER